MMEKHNSSHFYSVFMQVWGNIQSCDDPSRLMFDLLNHQQWYPLNPDGLQPLATVQQDLQYSETDNEKVAELRER